MIFLPYGIYRLAKAGFKKLSCTALNPSPVTAYFNKARREEIRNFLIRHCGGEKILVKTPDGYKIDSMLFRGAEKKVVIYCTGWKAYFESEKRFNYIRSITEQVGDINLLLFNSRGVGNSEGVPSAEGVALDLYSLFQYLVEVEGIDPNDVVIYGHSLGGAYGALGAALIQKEYSEAKINLFSDRSFCDYGENIRQLILKHLGVSKESKDYSKIKKKIGEVLGKKIVELVDFSSWKIQVENALESLKAGYALPIIKLMRRFHAQAHSIKSCRKSLPVDNNLKGRSVASNCSSLIKILLHNLLIHGICSLGNGLKLSMS